MSRISRKDEHIIRAVKMAHQSADSGFEEGTGCDFRSDQGMACRVGSKYK